MTYTEAKALIQTARSRNNGKPLACHTRLMDRGTYFAIRYHSTNIIEICSNGAYYLNSGGWQTATTKNRINRYMPFGWYLWQKDFQWYISSPGGLKGSKTYIFCDGFRIGPRGGCDEKRVKI